MLYDSKLGEQNSFPDGCQCASTELLIYFPLFTSDFVFKGDTNLTLKMNLVWVSDQRVTTSHINLFSEEGKLLRLLF
jgi:hypothetical protein